MPTTSAFYELLQAVESAVETLLSPGTIAASSIVIQDMPKHSTDLPKPYISISPAAEIPVGGTNASEDIEYPILIVYIADPDVTQLDARLKIREQIRRRFQMNGLTITLARFHSCRVTPAGPTEIQAWLNHGLFVSPMVVWCKVREAKS